MKDKLSIDTIKTYLKARAEGDTFRVNVIDDMLYGPTDHPMKANPAKITDRFSLVGVSKGAMIQPVNRHFECHQSSELKTIAIAFAMIGFRTFVVRSNHFPKTTEEQNKQKFVTFFGAVLFDIHFQQYCDNAINEQNLEDELKNKIPGNLQN